MSLGFKLEPGSPDVIVFDVGGRRPATAPESVLWAALQAKEQPTYQADLELAPDWNLTYEGMVRHIDGLTDALEQDTQRLQKLGVKCVLITLTVQELKQ